MTEVASQLENRSSALLNQTMNRNNMIKKLVMEKIKQVSIMGESSRTFGFEESGKKKNITLIAYSTRGSYLFPYYRLSLQNNYNCDSDAIKVKSLSTFAVRVVAFEGIYLQRDKSVDGLTGFSMEIIKLIMKQLAFDYKFIIPKDIEDHHIGFQHDNLSWSGMVKYLIDNEADICAIPIPVRDSYASKLEFTSAVLETSFNMVMARLPKEKEMMRLAFPFSPVVWLFIVLTNVVLGLVFWLIHKIYPNPDIETRSIDKATLSNCVFILIGSMLMTKLLVKPHSISMRLFYLVVWVTSLLFLGSYVGNMAALLSVTLPVTYPFRSFEDILNKKVIDSGYRWSFHDDADFQENLKLVDSPILNNLMMEAVVQKFPFISVNKSIDQLESFLLDNPRLMLLTDSNMASYVVARNCKLVLPSQTTGHQIKLALAMRPGWEYADKVKNIVETLRMSSDWQKLREKHLISGICTSNSAELRFQVHPINIEDFLSGIIVLVSGLIVAFLALGLEILIQKLLLHIQRRKVSDTFSFGKRYDCRITLVIPEGVWVEIENANESHFLPKDRLVDRKHKDLSLSELGMIVGTQFKIQYLGHDLETGEKIFQKFLK